MAPLLAVFSVEVVLALDVLTFLISAGTVAAIRVRPAARTGEPIGLRADLVAGFAALRAEPDVLIVITTFVLALVAASGFLTVGVVALVGDGFGGGNGQYGLLLGIAGVAEVFGALAVARLPLRNIARTAVLAWALLGLFRFQLGLAETPSSPLSARNHRLRVRPHGHPADRARATAHPGRHREGRTLGGGHRWRPRRRAVHRSGDIEQAGVRSAFMLSGVAMIAISVIASIALTRVGAGRPLSTSNSTSEV